MKDVLNRILTEGSHYRVHEVVIDIADIGEFMAELFETPGLALGQIEVTPYLWDDKREFVVKFKVWVDGSSEDD